MSLWSSRSLSLYVCVYVSLSLTLSLTLSLCVCLFLSFSLLLSLFLCHSFGKKKSISNMPVNQLSEWDAFVCSKLCHCSVICDERLRLVITQGRCGRIIFYSRPINITQATGSEWAAESRQSPTATDKSPAAKSCTNMKEHTYTRLCWSWTILIK